MQKQKMKLKLPVMMLLIVLISSCATSHWQLPVYPPQGELCIYHPDDIGWIPCSDIYTGGTTTSINIKDTKNWIMIPPESWKNIQNFMDQLRNKCD